MWLKHVKAIVNPPTTGNGNYTTYKNGDDWGMVHYCLNHITHLYGPAIWNINGNTNGNINGNIDGNINGNIMGIPTIMGIPMGIAIT